MEIGQFLGFLYPEAAPVALSRSAGALHDEEARCNGSIRVYACGSQDAKTEILVEMKQMDRREQEKYLQDVLREIGIREGHCILDCCCGAGTYTIPAAQLVGAKGIVYAVDRDFEKLG